MAEERLFEVLRPARRIDHTNELLRTNTTTYYRDDCTTVRLPASRVVSLQADEAELLVPAGVVRELDPEEAADYRTSRVWAGALTALFACMPIISGVRFFPAIQAMLPAPAIFSWTDVLFTLVAVGCAIVSYVYGPVWLWEKKKPLTAAE